MADYKENYSSINNEVKRRIDWVDSAKGLCIILVVMMHSTLGIEEVMGKEGFMHYAIAFAQPFRMPDFFLISGLFLARVIDRNWRTYLDRKVVHFAYFYVLWLTINFLLKAPGIITDKGLDAALYLYLEAFIQPLGTLWFIYLLPIFFVITKLTRHIHPIIMFSAAASIQVATIETGWIVIDHTAERFVFFFTGYWLAQKIFSIAQWAQTKTGLAVLFIIAWAFINGYLVFTGLADFAIVGLLLGFLGAGAIIIISAVFTKVSLARPIRYCGKHSIVIYLSFFLPINLVQLILIQTGVISSVGFMAIIITISGIIGPLLLWWLVRDTGLSFLFVRPAKYFLDGTHPSSHQPTPNYKQKEKPGFHQAEL